MNGNKRFIDLTRDSSDDEELDYYSRVRSRNTGTASGATSSASKRQQPPQSARRTSAEDVVVIIDKKNRDSHSSTKPQEQQQQKVRVQPDQPVLVDLISQRPTATNNEEDEDEFLDEDDEELMALRYPNGKARPGSAAMIQKQQQQQQNILDLTTASAGFMGIKPPVGILDAIIPLQLGQYVLYGIFPVRLVSSGLYKSPGGGFLDPVNMSRESHPQERARFYAYTKHCNVGYVEQRAAMALCRLQDDQRCFSALNITAGIPLWHAVEKSPTIPLFIMIYGPMSLFQTLSKIVILHGVQIVNRQAAVDSMQSGQLAPNSLVPGSSFGAPLRMTTATAQEYAFKQMEDIFSSIKGTDALPLTDPSPRIKSKLYPHQKMALTFLIEREKPHYLREKDSIVGSFWKRLTNHNGAEFFHNVLTNETSVVPPEEVKGGILADEMGLGKTITMLSLILTFPPEKGWVNSEPLRPVSRGTLLICPPSVVSTWEDQIKAHIDHSAPLRYYVFHGPNRNSSIDHLLQFEVIITTYSTLAQEFKTGGVNRKAKKRKALDNIYDDSSDSEDNLTLSSLHRILWHRIVLDEAHFIKEPTTLMAKAIYMLDADRRWCITGTPLQNKLDDLYSLVRFLRVEPFHDRVWWSRNILKSVSPDDGMMKLKTLVKCITLRRTKKQKIGGKPVVDLPPKNDSVWYIELDGHERSLYDAVFGWGKKTFQQYVEEGTVLKHYTTILEIFLRLRQICSHSALCSDNALIKAAMQNHSETQLGQLVIDDELSGIKFTPQHAHQVFSLLQDAGDDICVICGCDFDNVENEKQDGVEDSNAAMLTKCSHLLCRKCLSQLSKPVLCPLCSQQLDPKLDILQVKPWPFSRSKNASQSSLDSEIASGEAPEDDATTMFTTAASTSPPSNEKSIGPPGRTQSSDTSNELVIPQMVAAARPLDPKEMSAKFKALINDLNIHFDPNSSSPTKSVVFSQWTSLLDLLEPHLKASNLKFCRLDGKLNLAQRQQVIAKFRSEKDIALILMSLKAGGVGLDLCCANRIYLLDPWWNPSVELQAVDRVHRLGQTKPVETVRLVIKGSIEENILALQEKKAGLAREALNDVEEEPKKKQTADERKQMRLADLKFLFH